MEKPAGHEPAGDVADYRKNLTAMAQTPKERGTRVVLMTPNALYWTPALLKLYSGPPYLPNDADGMNVLLREYRKRCAESRATKASDWWTSSRLSKRPTVIRAKARLALRRWHASR